MKHFLCLSLVALTNTLLAQNLITNPGFETITGCEDSLTQQLDPLTGWTSFLGSPDFYNTSCPGYFGVPNNWIGSQQPYNGNGYAGIYIYGINGEREYLATHLAAPLVPGTTYYMSLRASWGEYCQFEANNLGFLFKTDTPAFAMLLTNPQVYNWGNIGNDSSWTITGNAFVADSAYEYLVLGNFFDNASTTITTHPTGILGAYYYIDDVCLSTDPTYCFTMQTSVKQTQAVKLDLYPSFTNHSINITFPQGSAHFNIFNAIGQSVYNGSIISLHQTVDVSGFSEGIYFVRVQTHQGVQTAKFVVQR